MSFFDAYANPRLLNQPISLTFETGPVTAVPATSLFNAFIPPFDFTSPSLTQTYSLYLRKAGTYTHPDFAGVKLIPSSFVVLPGPVDYSKTVLIGNALFSAPALGLTRALKLEAYDAFDNAIFGISSSEFIVTVIAPSSAVYSVSYSVSPPPTSNIVIVDFIPTETGSHTISCASPLGSVFATVVVIYGGLPILTQRNPSRGPTLGGTAVTITGSNFYPDNSCFFPPLAPTTLGFVYISPTKVICVTPAVGSAGVNDIYVINGVGQSAVPLNFTYYVDAAIVLSISPSFIFTYGDETIYLVGSGFLSAPPLCCVLSFPGTGAIFLPVTASTSTTATCITTRVNLPQTASVSVSNNCQNYPTPSPTNSQLLYVVQPYSQLCRQSDELSISRVSRLSLNLPYFPNIAAASKGGNASLSNPGFANGTFPAQIIDEDRCCELSVSNFGFKCGIQFPISAATSSAIVFFREPSYINYVLTSWYIPCRNTPLAYLVDYWNTQTNSWSSLLSRNIRDSLQPNVSPCDVAPSDIATVALCFDFVDEVLYSSAIQQFDHGCLSIYDGRRMAV